MNLSYAFRLCKENIGGVGKILFIDFIMMMIVFSLSYIPFIGVILNILISFAVLVLNLLLYNRVVIEKDDTRFVDIIKESIPIIKSDVSSYLTMILLYTGLMIGLCFITLIFYCGLFFLKSAFLFFVSISVFCIIFFYLSTYYTYIIQYKIAMLLLHTSKVMPYSDIISLIIACILLACIPIVGWIMLLLINIVLPVKILLDMK